MPTENWQKNTMVPPQAVHERGRGFDHCGSEKMKRCFLSGALLAVSLVTFTSVSYTPLRTDFDIYEELNDPLKERAHNIHKALSRSPVVIPFHYGPDGCILIPLQTGSNTVQIILDTGCAVTTIWQESMPPATKILQNISEEDSIGVLHDTRLGTIELGDLPVTISARNTREVRRDSEVTVGLLGGNVLKNFCVVINYQDKTLTLMNSASQPISAPRVKVVPLTIIENQIYVQISFDGQSYIQACVDTGACDSLGALAVLKPFLRKSQSVQNYVRVTKLRMDEIELLNEVFEIDDGANPDMGPAIIGDDILSHYEVAFDYPNKRMILVIPRNLGATPLSELSLADWLEDEGRLEESISLYSKVMSSEPELAPLALKGRACAYDGIEAYSRAFEDYSKIISYKFSPSDALLMSFQGRADLYARERKWKKALQDWDQAIRLGIASLVDAKKAESTFDHSDAMQKRTKGVEEDLAQSYVSRAYVYSMLKDFGKSAMDLDRAIALNKADAHAHDQKADFYQRADKWAEAVTECNEAIRLNPSYAEAYVRRGESYVMLNQDKKGLADLNHAIKLEPNVADHYVDRAWAFESIDNLDLAKRDRATARKLRKGKAAG